MATVDVASEFRRYMFLQRRREQEGLSPDELELWMRLKARLAERFEDGPPSGQAERRESPRIPARLRLRYDSFGEISQSLMTSVSRGGVFVAARSPLPIGSKVVLWIAIAEEGLEVEVPGEVVSHNLAPDLASEQRGMGVRFGSLTDDAQAAVDRIYERSALKIIQASGE